jgi:hypothetical protein
VAGTFVFLVLIGGSIALAHAGAKAKEDRLLAEKILRHLKSNPPISGARSIQLNRVIHDNIGSRPVHMLLEKIIKDKDVKILRNIPPFIKRTMQSKLYKDLWFVNDRTEMLDALLEIYGASEGEKKNVEFQLIRRLKALSRSAAVDLLDIIKTQDRPMMAQLLRMPLE